MISLALKCRGSEVEGPGTAGTAGICRAIVLSDFLGFFFLHWGGISLLLQAHGCDACDANV